MYVKNSANARYITNNKNVVKNEIYCEREKGVSTFLITLKVIAMIKVNLVKLAILGLHVVDDFLSEKGDKVIKQKKKFLPVNLDLKLNTHEHRKILIKHRIEKIAF